MQAPKIESSTVHNLVLSTFLPSQQVKHLAYFKMDDPKFIIHKNIELKFIIGLATATNNTLRLYAIYQNAIALELSSWRLHEDIVSIAGWDRLIVVNTGQRIIGLRFEQNFLRNSFMLSLQFLPLDDRDQCQIHPDRNGHYLLIKIKKFLIFCFSQTLASRYKSRVCEKEKVDIVGEQVRWNDPSISKPFICDIVKIRLSDLNLGNIDQICLVEDNIYFMGYRGKQSNLYTMNTHYFFNNKNQDQSTIAFALNQRDQPKVKTQTIVAHPRTSQNPQFLYIYSNPHSLGLKSQQNIYDIKTYPSEIKVLTPSVMMFPLLVWQPQQKKFTIISRNKNFQDTFDFKFTQLFEGVFAETVIYREGLIVTASRTEVIIMTNTGHKNTIHKSIGNLIDFHVGRDMIFVENYEGRKTRLFQMSRGPKVDVRPLVTHKKKIKLEEMNKGQIFRCIFSLKIGKDEESQQILAVKQDKVFSFFKEIRDDFEQILQPASEYFQFKHNDENLLLLRSADGNSGKIASFSENTFSIGELSWQGWKMQKRSCLGEYLIAYSGKKWIFFNVLLKQTSQFQFDLSRINNKYINSFFNFRVTHGDRQVSKHTLIELYICYSNLFEVWLLDLDTKTIKKIYQTLYPAEGCPVLTNQLFQKHPDSHIKDKYRSITCPQYCLNQHGIRSYQSQVPTVIAAHYYFSQTKSLLLMVTSQHQLLIYRHFFSVDQSGLLLRRVVTPLNVVKSFIWKEDKPFKYLGNGVVRAGNFFLYKGQLLESIPYLLSLFKMDGSLWSLFYEIVDQKKQLKIRKVKFGTEVIDGFWVQPIQCSFKQQLMGFESTPHQYCAFARKGFQIYNKQFESHWKCQLGNQTIVTLRTFQHYIAISYYDYYTNEEGINDYQSIKFKFRIYNCTTKTKIVERQKPLDEPILHIRFIPPNKILLVTSSVIFINLLKQDKTLQAFRSHNFTSRRSFLTAFAFIPDQVATQPGGTSSPTYMLFGGTYGGLGFYVGKWIQEQKLMENWFEGLRCPIRHVSFFYFGEKRQDGLKALVVDEESNLLILRLKFDRAEKIADFRLGALANSIKSMSGRGQNVFITLNDGSIRLLNTARLENAEVDYLDFQTNFCSEMPFIGGFNLRKSRQMQQKYRSAKLVSRGNMVDGDLLQQFFSMTSTLQNFITQESQMEQSALKSIIPF